VADPVLGRVDRPASRGAHLKALFLVNASSGPNRRLDIASLIRRSCRWPEFDVIPSESKEDLDGIVAGAQRNGFGVVFAVGGDGTVHEVAKRLLGTDLALAIVPTGSGNGFARHLRIPMNPLAAMESSRNRDPLRIDTGEVDGRPFVGVMGVGFDAHIAHEFAAHPARGLRTYLKVGLAAIARYRPEEYEIVADGETISTRAFAVDVANASQYGNNARVAATASVRDGLLDLVIIRDVSILAMPILLGRVFTGTLHRSRAVITRQVHEVIIRRQAAGQAHVDGEPIELGAEVRVGVRPQSLNVIAPADADTI
jgi:diacylglycerol kinase (ATP)